MIEPEIMIEVARLSTLTNVNFVRALQGTIPPYCTISKLSSPRGKDMQGNDGTAVSTMQISIFATNYKTCKEYASELYPLSSYASSTVSNIVLANEFDIFDDISKCFEIALEFKISHYV